MCFTNIILTRISHCPVVVILMKYPRTSFVVGLLGFLACSTLLLSRVFCSQHVQFIYPLFHSESPVRDISNGSLETLHAIMQKSSLHFVMYYTHWCAQSWKLVYEFHRASRKFKGQVSFLAINCWTGSCKQHTHFHTYPQLFFHHTGYKPLEYRGRHKTIHLIKFVEEVLYPFTYISNNLILQYKLKQGNPLLLAFFNGTNYLDQKYNKFFEAALQCINKVTSLQFGVITSFQVAALIGLEKFGQLVLINTLGPPQMYPALLNFSDVQILQWAEQNKVEYVRELEPELTDPKEFGALIRSDPSLILFVPQNGKDSNVALLHLYRQVATSYHNCSCDTFDPSQNNIEDFPAKTQDTSREEIHERTCGKRLENAHVTSCQSLPLSYSNRYGMQNVCDVCRECYEMCSCNVDSFPLRSSTSALSILQGLTPLRNSCRSLRKNYQESNTLSVCCFQNTIPRYREMIVSETPISVNGEIRTDVKREEHLRILANKFEILNGDIKEAVSRNDPGILKRLLGNLMTMFTSGTAGDTEEQTGDRIAGSDGATRFPEYHEYGTCEQRGKIRVFNGASCYSNITVKYYFMDSRKYWSYAVAFGVKHVPSRVALILVDVKNEAQYVFPEDSELSNGSIVDFVMKFMRGNLRRRLRSASLSNQSCRNSGCITEVISLTFTQLVLDPTKDVLLMYYTPWCGFCKSIKPIYLALADHYKTSMHIRIARINADVNDLPWEYTVDFYPKFIFFPAKRKDLSVIFHENEDRTLENFIHFVEKHKSRHVSPVRSHVLRHDVMKIRRLERGMRVLTKQKNHLRWRLKNEIESRLEAEKRRLKTERQIVALLADKKDDELSRFDLQYEVQKLTLENAELLQDVSDAKERLKIAKMHREISEKTVEALRTRNFKLGLMVSSLKEQNSNQSKETTNRTENKS